MKAKVIKKQNKQLLDTLKPIIEAESAQVESALNSCADIINGISNRLLPNASEELKDTFYTFMTHGLTVVLIKQNKKGEETK